MTQRVQHGKRGISPAACQSTLRRQTVRGRQTMVMRDFGTYFDANWETIALDEDIGRMELRLLLLSAVSVEKENRIPYSQVDLALKLGVTRQAVQRAMAALLDKGLLFKRGHTYYLNSRLATHAPLVDLIDIRRREREYLQASGVSNVEL